MGRMFEEVDNEISEVPYIVDKNSNGACVVKANEKNIHRQKSLRWFYKN